MDGLKGINLARPCITSQTLMSFNLNFKTTQQTGVKRLLPTFPKNSLATANHMQHKELYQWNLIVIKR